ncbi:phage tail protein I [Escherichia coli]
MNTLANIQELARALRNMIRTGIIVETDLNAGRCRVQTGGMCTDWLQWLTHRAGRSRTWWAPSVGEQVLILSVGGELDTAFVLPGIYSGDNPAPSASADALHIRFPDGAVIEYEPETSALTVSGIKTASVTASDSVTATVPVVIVKASTRITLDTPEVVCTNRLITGTLEVQKGGTMRGNIEHTGGELSSNGKVLHTHNPDTCPANLLPWLAWAFSVDRWDEKWPEATKRAVIRDAYFIHCHKGTIGAIRRVVEPLGYLINVTEWWENSDPPGTFRLDIGVLESGITEAMYQEMERLIADAKPASRHLIGLNISRDIPGYLFAGGVAYDGDVITVYPG